MNSTTALTAPSSSSNTTTSTLRPRQRRLISGLDEDLELNPASSGTTRTASPLLSPFGSRAASPIPSKHPSRTSASPGASRSTVSGGRLANNERAQGAHDDALGSLSDIWGNSWSALQGLASSVLGGEMNANDKHTRRRRPLEATHKRNAKGGLPSQWGPSTSASQIGTGTKEGRESLVRAMKRQDLLAANGHVYPDSTGKFKRRNSDERISFSAPPGDNENRDALVYVHKVQPNDTLAGITIRFNCAAAVLRKANRMWPNDTVQTRKTIVIPVDACGIKGRPVPPPAQPEEDLLLSDEDKILEDGNAASKSDTNGWSRARAQSNTTNRPPSSATSSKAEPDPPWIHDSWVLFPGDTEPTEIARLPRRTLSYFPPARRRSVTHSDTNSPPASLDVQRVSIPSPPRDVNDIETTSPISRPSRRRAQSITAKFPLNGPGGVGTLGKNVRVPGPAQDGLNKLFASHLPNVDPPQNQNQDSHAALPSELLENSPNIGFRAEPSGPAVGIDFEAMGGAIETWVRKMATKASKALNEPSSSQLARMTPVPGLSVEGGGLGDLIELQDDPFEIGDDEREADRGRAATMPLFSSTGRSGLPGGMRERDKGKAKSGKGD